MSPTERNLLAALRADNRVHIYSETERALLFGLADKGYLHDVYELAGADFTGHLTHKGIKALDGKSTTE